MLSFLIWPLISSLLAGAVLTFFYYLYFFIKNYIQNRFLSTLTIESSDLMFQWVLDYLLLKGYISRGMSNFTCKIQRNEKNKYIWEAGKDFDQDFDRPKIAYTPGVGYHSFLFKGLRIYFTHVVIDRVTVGFERKPMTVESIKLMSYGLGNVGKLKELCDEAMLYAMNQDKNKTSVYALHEWLSIWEKVQTKRQRPLETVILDANITEEIMNDMVNFKQNQQWYIDRGVPYRRGYLLYGPPGTGKTSFLLAIAGQLNLSICTLNLSGNELDDERLNKVLEIAPKNAVILLDDVDAIFVERTSVGQNREGRKVSFSGLLNAIDGVRSQEGRILFMTTNHIEKLDPALLRPGRADVHVKLDYATSTQIRKMFLRFFPEAEKGLVEDFVKKVPENKLSMAKLQGHFLRNKNKPQKAIENVKDLIEVNEYTNEMSIKDWLFRLGFEGFSEGFMKENIWRVVDLKGLDEGGLETYGVKKLGDQKRIINMLKGDDLSKKAFCLMSKSSIRSLLNLYLKDSQEIESLVNLIPENLITEYHLRDVFDEEGKKTLEDRIKLLVEKTRNYLNQGKIEKKPEKKKEFPKETPEEILIRLGMEKNIETFKNNNALMPEIFWNLKTENLSRHLKVELVGKRMKLMKIIDEFNGKEDNDEENDLTVNEMNNIIGLKKQVSVNY